MSPVLSKLPVCLCSALASLKIKNSSTTRLFLLLLVFQLIFLILNVSHQGKLFVFCLLLVSEGESCQQNKSEISWKNNACQSLFPNRFRVIKVCHHYMSLQKTFSWILKEIIHSSTSSLGWESDSKHPQYCLYLFLHCFSVSDETLASSLIWISKQQWIFLK